MKKRLKQFDLTLSVEEKAKLEAAAALECRSLASFMRYHSLERAKQLVQEADNAS